MDQFLIHLSNFLLIFDRVYSTPWIFPHVSLYFLLPGGLEWYLTLQLLNYQNIKERNRAPGFLKGARSSTTMDISINSVLHELYLVNTLEWLDKSGNHAQWHRGCWKRHSHRVIVICTFLPHSDGSPTKGSISFWEEKYWCHKRSGLWLSVRVRVRRRPSSLQWKSP